MMNHFEPPKVEETVGHHSSKFGNVDELDHFLHAESVSNQVPRGRRFDFTLKFNQIHSSMGTNASFLKDRGLFIVPKVWSYHFAFSASFSFYSTKHGDSSLSGMSI